MSNSHKTLFTVLHTVYTQRSLFACLILTLNHHLALLHMPVSSSLSACLSHAAFNCGAVAGPALCIDFMLLKAEQKGN